MYRGSTVHAVCANIRALTLDAYNLMAAKVNLEVFVMLKLLYNDKESVKQTHAYLCNLRQMILHLILNKCMGATLSNLFKIYPNCGGPGP